MSRVIEAVAPSRLGADFRYLMASTWISNLGDGIALAAGPLLVASQTRSPALVSMAFLLQGLPWLLFGLFAGAIADRVDRKLMVAIADCLRGVVLLFLCTAIVTDVVNVTLVLVAMFLIGTAEVFADTAYRTLLPMLVPKADLGIGQSRLQAGYVTLNQLAGAPIGAALFAAGMAVPFGVQIACGLMGVVLILRLSHSTAPDRGETDSHVLRDIGAGFRWLMGHGAIRTLALVITTFNVTWAASWSVLVLYSLEILDMGAVGYGLLTTSAAVGGVIATVGYGWLEKRMPIGLIMKVCLTCEVFMHLAFAVTTVAWVAMLIMFGFGLYAFVWTTISQVVQQRAVPKEFQGRVGSVYAVGIFLGIVIGSALGGLIAEHWGITAPFWFAFVASAITLVLVWGQLEHIAHEGEAVPADDAPQQVG